MVTIVYLTEFPSYAKYEFSWVPQTNICSTTNYVVRSTSKSGISTNSLGAVYKVGMVSWNIVYVNSHIDWISLEEEVHTSKQWINTKTEKQRADHTHQSSIHKIHRNG